MSQITKSRCSREEDIFHPGRKNNKQRNESYLPKLSPLESLWGGRLFVFFFKCFSLKESIKHKCK